MLITGSGQWATANADPFDGEWEDVPGELMIRLADWVGRPPLDGRSFGLADVDLVLSSFDLLRIDAVAGTPSGDEEHDWWPPIVDGWPNIARMYRVVFVPSSDLDTAQARLGALTSVDFVHPNRRFVPAKREAGLVNAATSRMRGGCDPTDPFPPNDPYYSSQWWLDQLNAEDAWELTTGNPNVIGVIFDRDFQWNHEDLSANVWLNADEDIDGDGVLDDSAPPPPLHPAACCVSSRPEDFSRAPQRVDCPSPGGTGDANLCDDDATDPINLIDDFMGWNWHDDSADVHYSWLGGHGTNCAGVFAAATNNCIGVTGIAGGDGSPGTGCRIMPVIGLDEFSWAQSLLWSRLQGARLFSLSIPVSNTQASLAAAEDAWNNDLLIFAAAGNLCQDIQNPICYSEHVFCTGGAEGDGLRWERCILGGESSSYRNPNDPGARVVEAIAPASEFPGLADRNIATTNYDPTNIDEYNDNFGATSAATPIAMGVAGLVQSYVYENTTAFLSASKLAEVLQQSAIDIGTDVHCTDCAHEMLGQDRYTGYGRLDAYRALTAPTLVLLSPNGGETLAPGQTVSIQWRAWDINGDWAPVPTVDLFYSSDATHGGSWTSIATVSTSTDDTVNSYTWTVPTGDPTGPFWRLRIRASDSNGHTGVDVSDDFFSVLSFGTRDVAPIVAGVPSAYPNPFSVGVQIRLPNAPPALSANIFNVGGRLVASVPGRVAAGEWIGTWNGRDHGGEVVTPGVYFARFSSDSRSTPSSVLIVKTQGE